MRSSFKDDLRNEQILGSYLDKIYSEIFDPKEIEIIRISDYDKQNSGIDLIPKSYKLSYSMLWY